jgi:hypothetical protein
MSIKAASIKNKCFTCMHIHPSISIPNTFGNKRGIDGSALALKWTHQTRNDLVEEDWDKDVKLRIISLRFNLHIESPTHTIF